MAAQVLNDSCQRQRDKDAKKMMHNFYEDSSTEAFLYCCDGLILCGAQLVERWIGDRRTASWRLNAS